MHAVSAVDAYAATLAQQDRDRPTRPGRPGQARSAQANEDAFRLRAGEPPWFALADGAGAAEGAARRALGLFERLTADATVTSFATFPSWAGWLRAIDTAMLGGAESTLVVVAVLADRVVGASAGDSRAYLWRRDGEVLLLNEGSAKSRLGSGRVDPFPLHAPFERGDLLVLLSDGAWTQVSLTRLAATIARGVAGPLADIPEALLREASRSGRADDMTAVVARRRA